MFDVIFRCSTEKPPIKSSLKHNVWDVHGDSKYKSHTNPLVLMPVKLRSDKVLNGNWPSLLQLSCIWVHVTSHVRKFFLEYCLNRYSKKNDCMSVCVYKSLTISIPVRSLLHRYAWLLCTSLVNKHSIDMRRSMTETIDI